MKKNNLLDRVEKDNNIRVKTPDDLHAHIMDGVRKEKKRMFFIRALVKYAALTVTPLILAVIILVTVLSGTKDIKVVMIYPYGGEEKVEIAGSFNHWKQKIPMRLDKTSGLWTAEIHMKPGAIYEYQYIIDEIIYTSGGAKMKVVDNDGNEKGLISL